MEQAPPQSNPQTPPPPPSSSTPATTTTTDVSSAALPPPATATTLPQSYPSPSPTPPQMRPGVYNNRPWPPQQQQQQLPPPSHYQHYPSPAAPNQRGGMAIGVPAANPSAPHIPPPPQFASHNQPFTGMARGVPDTGTTSSSPQVRPGMGPLGMRPSMGAAAHQLRPAQSSPRPQSSPNVQPPVTQNFQGHSMLRGSATGPSGVPSPGSSQGLPAHTQPWLNGNSPARPPLPSANRPQMSPQTVQQRSQASPQLQNPASATSQQQQLLQAQQQSQQSSSPRSQEHHGSQFSQARIQPSLPNQPQVSRNPSLGTQRAPLVQVQAQAQFQTVVQTQTQVVNPSTGIPSRVAFAEPEEPCSRILRKRSIQELVSQVDPSEKLDPGVEDILVDIAEDFIESVTSFGCSLAKHRKSSTLEAKDILLHLERNWNVTLPGFGGDEIKTYKKPVVSDIHKERLAVVKKSIIANETTNSKGGNPKGHVAKGPNNLLGSPPAKIREAA